MVMQFQIASRPPFKPTASFLDYAVQRNLKNIQRANEEWLAAHGESWYKVGRPSTPERSPNAEAEG